MAGVPNRRTWPPCHVCEGEGGAHSISCPVPLSKPARYHKPKPPPKPRTKASQPAAAQLEPRVINVHHYRGRSKPQPYIYIGRPAKGRPPHPLANPYPKRDYGKRAIRLYEKYLRERIAAGDRLVIDALDSITAEHSLGCFCVSKKTPKKTPCHGHVVVKVWRERQGLDAS